MPNPMRHPSDLLARYTAHWRLTPEDAPFYTDSSALQAVRWRGQPAMLKIALSEEEQRGHRLMAWWDGQGAARILGRHGSALLMERLGPALHTMATADAEADAACARILCRAAAALHRAGTGQAPPLAPLARWFDDLLNAKDPDGGTPIGQAALLAEALLAAPRDEGPLHGDLHHGNVLHGAARGWLAIDPKGLWGERTFDYANLFCNPDLDIVAAPGRFDRLLALVTEEARLERRRLLCWIAAWSGLSTLWHRAEGCDGRAAEFVLQAALARLALD